MFEWKFRTIFYVCIKFLCIIITLFVKINHKIHYFNDKNTYNICLHLKLQNYFILLSKHFTQLKNCVYENKLNDWISIRNIHEIHANWLILFYS